MEPRITTGRDGTGWPRRRNLVQIRLKGRKWRLIVKLNASRVSHPGEVAEHRDHTDRRLDLLLIESLSAYILHSLPRECPRLCGQRCREPNKATRAWRKGLVVSLEDGRRCRVFAACNTQKLRVSGRSIEALVGA